MFRIFPQRSPENRRKFICVGLAILFALSAVAVRSVSAQGISINEVKGSNSPKLNRERGLNMLDEIKDLIKQYYYDPNFHGINLDERFKTAEERIKKMDTNYQIFRVIAQVLIDFNDSHTRFYPPNRSSRVEYGFSLQMIGNKCFVVDVKKGGDAETKGLKIGDEVAAVNKYVPTRENLWKMMYLLYALDPQEQVNVVVLNADGKTEREMMIKASFKTLEDRRKESRKRRAEKKEKPYKCVPLGANAIACRLETFSVEKSVVDKMMKEVAPHRKFILDLRGNGGGYVKTLQHLAGYFFDREVKIGEMKSRKKTEVVTAKPNKEKFYGGELTVLIDSESASASEVLARVLQLEKRGKIIGDTSSGAVMTSNFFNMANSRGVPGYETLSFYAINLTVADLVMSDGKRLENVGVAPDVPIGPNGYALSLKTDPILAYAANLFGAQVTPEQAGGYYFMIKKPEDEDQDEDKDAGESNN